jgi:hypothetical protein
MSEPKTVKISQEIYSKLLKMLCCLDSHVNFNPSNPYDVEMYDIGLSDEIKQLHGECLQYFVNKTGRMIERKNYIKNRIKPLQGEQSQDSR